MIDTLWSYGKLLYRLYGYRSIYKATGDHDASRIPSLLEAVYQCGSVCIKFCQWMIPIMEIMYIEENKLFDLRYDTPTWIQRLKRVYEECPEHSLAHTYASYKKAFSRSFTEDYRNLGCIGSGSIGQVYKIQDICSGRIYAMKVLHPNIDRDIWLFESLYRVIHGIACMYYRCHSLVPFNVPNFIRIFKEQSDFVREGNNLLRMKETYRDNPYLVFPEVHRVSKEILIMEYIEGETFESLDMDRDVSEICKSNIYTVLYLFTRDMIFIQNFNHGDLHPSNWKVIRDPKSAIGYKVVLYDFGFCWSDLRKVAHNTIDIMESYDSSEKATDEHFKRFSEIFYNSIEHDHLADKVSLRTDIIAHLQSHPLVGKSDVGFIITPISVYNVVNDYCYDRGIAISPTLIQFVILYTQLHLTCAKYGYSEIQGISNRETLYKDRYMHTFNFCNTYDIFPEYRDFVAEKLTRLQPFRKGIFDILDSDVYQSLTQDALCLSSSDKKRGDDTEACKFDAT